MLFFVTFSTETKTSPKGNKNDDEEDDENDDEEEDKEEVEDREPPLIRTGFLAVLKDVLHPFHTYAKAFHKVIKEGMEKFANWVSEQPLPENLDDLVIILGSYPAGLGQECKTNRTVNNWRNVASRTFKKDVNILWRDVCLLSSTTTNKIFYQHKIGPILGDSEELCTAYFVRGVRTTMETLEEKRKERGGKTNQLPVFITGGKQIEENAFNKWKDLGFVEIKKELYKIESIRLVEVEVKQGDWKRRAMYILGGNHPSAILHNPGKENDSNLATTICLAIAAISFAQRENESTGFAPFLDDAKKRGGKFALTLAKRCEILIQRREAWTGADVFKNEEEFLKRLMDAVVDTNEESGGCAWFNQEFTHLHNVEMEDVRVQSSFQTFIELFRGADGKLNEELLLRMFKIKSLMSRLGKSETSKDYLVSFMTFIDEFCIGADGKPSVEVMAQIMNEHLASHLADGTHITALRNFVEAFCKRNDGKTNGELLMKIINACFTKRYANGAFISSIEKIIVDYFNGNCNLFATKCCDGLFAALNSEAKTVELRKRIDLLIAYDGDGDKNPYDVNNTFLAAASGNSFYAGLSGVEGDEYAKYLLEIRERFYKNNPDGFASACSRNYMCALLSYKKDGKLTGELISNLAEIQMELFAGSELVMTQALWQKFSEKKREEKKWTTLTDAEKEKLTDAEYKKRSKGAVHAFIQQERLLLEKERGMRGEAHVPLQPLGPRDALFQRIEKQRLEEEQRRIQQDRLEEERKIQCIQERLEEQQRSQRIQQEILLLKEGKMEMEEENENEDGDDDEDKRQGGGEARVPLQQLNK